MAKFVHPHANGRQMDGLKDTCAVHVGRRSAMIHPARARVILSVGPRGTKEGLGVIEGSHTYKV